MAAVIMSTLQRVQGLLLSLPLVGSSINTFFSSLPIPLRFGAGCFSAGNLKACKRPQKRIILYEWEGCPFCRKVREAISTLALEVEVRPCPRETLARYAVCDKSRYRPEVKAHPKGGVLKFPFLVDENNDVAMYESEDIMAYLWREYGDKATMPWSTWLSTLPGISIVGTMLCMLCRLQPEHGIMRCPSSKPAKPLELWSFEHSPYCRLVREALCSLEIPYMLHNVPHGAAEARRYFFERCGDAMAAEAGAFLLASEGKVRYAAGVGKFPWLVDPNTNVSMGESAKILAYLNATYKTGEIDTRAGDLGSYSTAGATKDHGTIPGASKKSE